MAVAAAKVRVSVRFGVGRLLVSVTATLVATTCSWTVPTDVSVKLRESRTGTASPLPSAGSVGSALKVGKMLSEFLHREGRGLRTDPRLQNHFLPPRAG